MTSELHIYLDRVKPNMTANGGLGYISFIPPTYVYIHFTVSHDCRGLRMM